MATLTLAELGQFLRGHYRRDVLRVETRQSYRNDAEAEGLRRYLAGEPPTADSRDTPWIRQLRTHVAAGRSWRVLHAVTEPLTPYCRYEMAIGYTNNAAVGQQIRIAALNKQHTRLGDLLIIDGQHVFQYRYGPDDRFAAADHLTGQAAAEVVTQADTLWNEAADFGSWWAAHPAYHGRPAAA